MCLTIKKCNKCSLSKLGFWNCDLGTFFGCSDTAGKEAVKKYLKYKVTRNGISSYYDLSQV